MDVSFFSCFVHGLKAVWAKKGKRFVSSMKFKTVVRDAGWDEPAYVSPLNEEILEKLETTYNTGITIVSCSHYDMDSCKNIRVIRFSTLEKDKDKEQRFITLFMFAGLYFYVGNWQAFRQVYCCGGCRKVATGKDGAQIINQHRQWCPALKEKLRLREERKAREREEGLDRPETPVEEQRMQYEPGAPQAIPVKEKYVEKAFKPRQYPFHDLEKAGLMLDPDIMAALKKEYMIVWDCESYLRSAIEEETALASNQMSYTFQHKMACISAASNVPGFEEKFFIDDPEAESDGEEEREAGEPEMAGPSAEGVQPPSTELDNSFTMDSDMEPDANDELRELPVRAFVKKFLNWCVKCAKKAEQAFLEKPAIRRVLDEIQEKIQAATERNNKGLVKILKAEEKKLHEFARRLVLLSYNGGNYDMVLLRECGGFYYLNKLDGDLRAIRKGTCYMLLQTKHLRFVDLLQFMGSKCSLRDFLRSYQLSTKQLDDETLKKMHFCYH